MGTAEENHAKLMKDKPWEDFGWDQKTWEQTVNYTPYEGIVGVREAPARQPGRRPGGRAVLNRDKLRDPSYAGSPEAWRAGLGLADSNLVGLDPQNPLNRVSPVGGGDETPTGPRGPGGPAAPRGPSIYDMQKGQLDRLLASQMEGAGSGGSGAVCSRHC
jgi:hypothetical protein